MISADSAYFLKTPHRRGTQIHADKWSSVALVSHLDPIGDQNDVRQWLIYYIYMWQIRYCTKLRLINIKRNVKCILSSSPCVVSLHKQFMGKPNLPNFREAELSTTCYET